MFLAGTMSATPAANTNASLDYESNPKLNLRRRTVAVVERRSTSEMHSDVGANGVSDDRMAAIGKDLSHTIRGEYVVERPRDASQSKTGLVASATAVSPRRRKPASKQEKPRWQTVLSVLTKNCLLLAFIVWLGQTIWKWSDGIQESTMSPFAGLDYEGRISEVEASLKRTAKMLQVQLDVVDRKIGSEIGAFMREVVKQVEEKAALFEKELKQLEGRTYDLDKSLAELRDTGLITKEEFESFWGELKNTRSLNGNAVNLDQVRAVAKDIVQKGIEKHAADGVGRADYALASAGARVIRHSAPYDRKSDRWFAAAKGRNGVHADAQKMLQPSFGEPGQCFPLEGSEGFVTIKLRAAIIPEAITLEHVSKSVAFDRSSAPKDCQVWGWLDENPLDAPKLVARFSYDLEKSSVQTFNVMDGVGVINNVRLEIKSNHGSSSVTCIYRLRVHGYEPRSPADSDILS